MRSLVTILPFIAVFLIAFAMALQSVYSSDLWLSWICWVLSAIVAVLWIFFNVDNIKRSFSRKGAKYGASSGFAVILGVLVIFGVVFLSNKPRFDVMIDLTRDEVNTLSDQSLKVISSLNNKKVVPTILAFFDSEASKKKFGDLLKIYSASGFKCDLTYIDPHADPTKAISENISLGNTVLLKNGKQQARITAFTEEKFTNALIKVMKTKTKKVYFIRGHGEGGISGRETSGFEIVAEELRVNNYQVEELILLEKGKVINNDDLLIVAGPRYDFKREELVILEEAISKGVSLLLLVDALTPVDNLNGLIKKYGIEFSDDLLLLNPNDRRASMLGQNNAIISVFDDFHSISRDFAKLNKVALLVPNTRSLRTNEGNKYSLKVNIIAKTSGAIVGVADVKTKSDLKNIGGKKIKNDNFPVIAVSQGMISGKQINALNQDELKHRNGIDPVELRVAAVGSSYLANNVGAQRKENLDMFINIVNYLLQDDDFISIRPRDLTKSTIDLTSLSSQIILIVISYIYPFIFLGAGLIIWLRRRGHECLSNTHYSSCCFDLSCGDCILG